MTPSSTGAAAAKLAAFLLVLLLANLVLGGVYALLGPSFGADPLGAASAQAALFALAVAGASWLAARALDARPWSSLGLRWHRRAPLELLFGVALGVGLLAALWGIDALWAAAAEGGPPAWPAVQLPASRIPLALLFFLLVAFNEELLVRGFPLQLLIGRLGVPAAVVLTSVAFGLLHLTGNAWNAAVVALDTGFSGALFAVAYWKTRGLWMPMALHFTNNAAIFLLEAPPLEAINQIPPAHAQGAFWSWWAVNFPLYVVLLWGLARWRYAPDAALDALFHRHVLARAEAAEADQPR